MVFGRRHVRLRSVNLERRSIRANIALAGLCVEVLLALVIVVLVVGALVLPWIQRGEIDRLKSDVFELRKQITKLREHVLQLAVQPVAQPEVAAASPVQDDVGQREAAEAAVRTATRVEEVLAAVEAKPEPVSPAPAEPVVEIVEHASVVEETIEIEAAASAAPADAAPPSAPPQPSRPKISWEQQIGARLPVWVGGIALALAGIFLVKYSIDTGLLNPAVRCALAGLLGALMLGGAQWVIGRGTVANGERIAQALSGAGIAVLYGTLFAAATVYGFISPAQAFAGMAAVTALAVFLSLRHGQPIAVLGMIGGFLTPGLVEASEPNPAVLFGYLAALTIGLFVVIRRQNWWWLGWPTILAAFLWVVIWLVGGGAPGDGFWLGLFLIVLSVTSFSFVGPQIGDAEGHERNPFAWLGLILTAAASVFLMCVVLVRSQFDVTEWGLYGVLAGGTIALAVRDQERYRYLPWMTMAASAILFAVWVTPDTEFFALVLFLFSMLFVISGTVMMWRAKDPVEWGGLACASALIFYLIALGRLHQVTEAARVLAPDTLIGSWPVWGIIAVILATAATLVTGRVAQRFPTADIVTQKLLAQFSLTATAFLALGLSVEIDRPYLAVAIAAQAFAVAWANTRVDIRVLRWTAGVLAALFLFLILPQLNAPIEYAIRATFGLPLDKLASVPIAARPLFHLGVPALMFALASWFLRRQADDWLVRMFETGAVVLFGIMGYYAIRLAHVPAVDVLSSPGTSLEGAIVTHTLMAYAIALVVAGRQFARQTLIACGLGAAALAIARVVQFDIQPVQLLGVWLPMAFGEVSTTLASLPIATSPVFYLGVPAVLLITLRSMLGRERDDWLVRLIEYVAVVLAGLMGYFLIRHAFHPVAEVLTSLGSRFEGGVISQAQIVYAIALVVAGHYFARASLVNAGLVAAAMAVARIAFFDAQPLLLLGVGIKMSFGQPVDAALTLPIAASPLFHLGLPAVLLAALAFVLSRGRGARFAALFEYTAIIFVGFMGYYLIRHAFNPPELVFGSAGTFLERGVLTNALLIFGLALYAGGQRWKRQSLLASGVAAAGLAVLRIVFFDISTSSPLVAPHDVGALPILNALLLPYGLPVVWLTLLARALTQRRRTDLLPYVNGAALLFAFAWISLNVRQLFQGAVLNTPSASNSEVYYYSVAWLVLGIGLLVAGAARKDRVMRIASLAVMVLTVGKAFLYDASELTGLLRVASFLGLGLSLLGLSWFYTRYVFVREDAQEATSQVGATGGA